MYLRGVLAGLVGSLAGCASSPGGDESVTPPTPATTPSPPAPSRTSDIRTVAGPRVDSVAGVGLPVPERDLLAGMPPGAIRAITEPAFADDWSGLEFTRQLGDGETETVRPRLTPADAVVGIARAGDARAYPLRVLGGHEVVNDDFHGPLLVTYCPVCASGVTAKRLVGGEPTGFGVTGLLWRRNLVLFDERTGSLWSQIAMTAIRGPLTGLQLELLPSSITTLGAWREAHPETDVLLPPPRSKVRYQDLPGMGATGRYTREGDPVTATPGDAGGLTLALGIVADGAAKAYPLPAVKRDGPINDVVGNLPVVVDLAPGRSLVAYERVVDGTVHRFRRADPTTLEAAGSRWRLLTGVAIDGPHAGSRLARPNDIPQLFLETWQDFHPETTVYGETGDGG